MFNMKKYIFLLLLSGVMALSIHAQDATGAPAGYKVMTTAEANHLNGTVEPMINGKPYSQFKAEQAAKKSADQKQTLPVTPVMTAQLERSKSAPAVSTKETDKKLDDLSKSQGVENKQVTDEPLQNFKVEKAPPEKPVVADKGTSTTKTDK